jgi:hypothetical protein
VTTDARKLAEAVVAEARRQGWRVEHGGRHWKLYAPDGVTIEIVATTPRRASGVEASIRRMRRAGFVWKDG